MKASDPTPAGTENEDNRMKDLTKLRHYCSSKYGLVNKAMRKRAWPILLNVKEILQQEQVLRTAPN